MDCHGFCGAYIDTCIHNVVSHPDLLTRRAVRNVALRSSQAKGTKSTLSLHTSTLLCSHSPNDVPPEPQRNVSIAAVRGAVRPYVPLADGLFIIEFPTAPFIG